MDKLSKVIIMVIVIDMGFKSDMVEGGRGLHVSKKNDQPQNFPGLPPIFPGFPNWNFPGQQNPGQPNDSPGFPGFNITSPLFPFLPYFTFDPPQYCIPIIGCIPLPDFRIPVTEPPPAAPVLPPPDQDPLAPVVQPSPTNPSPVQPPPTQTNPLQPPLVATPPIQNPPPLV